jgi:hypothetical protein
MKWRCNDGRELTLQEMETTHLRNSIAKIRRSIRVHKVTGAIAGWRLQFLKPMVAEIERRGRKDNTDLKPSRISNRFRNLDLN